MILLVLESMIFYHSRSAEVDHLTLQVDWIRGLNWLGVNINGTLYETIIYDRR